MSSSVLDALQGKEGQEIGVSRWFLIDQSRIDTFARVGRLKEMFKSGGYNVYLREIEIALEAYPAAQLAAVLGVPDPVYAEVGHAFVMVAEGAQLTEEQLREHCRARRIEREKAGKDGSEREA